MAEQGDALRELNQQGAGVFVTVNATDGNGRKKQNITGVRALFADFDGLDAMKNADAAAAKLPPSIIVESSPGKRHLYWLLTEGAIEPYEFISIIKPLIAATGADPNAGTIERVLRLPGFMHNKGEPVPVKLLSADPALRYGKDAILGGFGIDAGVMASTTAKESHSDPFATMPDPFWTAERLREVLGSLDPNISREKWRVVGFALKNQLGAEAAAPLFKEWSRRANRISEKTGHPTFEQFDAGWKDILSGKEAFQIGTMLAMDTDGVVADIRKRASGVGAMVQPSTMFASFKDLIALKTNPTWLIRGFIDAGTLNAIAGAPKNYKSFIAVDMGLCMAAGIPWCGRTVTQGAVFVIAGEGSGGMSRRIAAWRKTHPEVPEGIPFFVTHRAHTLNADGARVIADVIDEMAAEHSVNPVAVIIDTLARSFEGDENNTQDMNAFVQNVDSQLKREGRAVIIVHHSTKSGVELLRGSGALKAALDGLFEVAKDDKDLMRATFTTHFLKDAESQKPMAFNMERHILGFDDEMEEVSSLVPVLSIECRPLSEAAKAAHAILKKLDKGDGVALTLWRDNCEERSLLGSGEPEAKKSAMRRLIQQLGDSGLIEKSERGSYRSTT